MERRVSKRRWAGANPFRPWMRASLVLAWLGAIGAAAGTAQCRAAELLEVDVFAQSEEGYHTYRIPSLVRAKDETLIALVEGRRDRAHDPGGGHIDLVYKRSRDGGRTWSSLKVFEKSQEQWGASNPTAVVNRKSGRIFVCYNRWKPGRGGRNSRPGTLDNQLWMRTSDDHGATWSEPRDLTQVGRDVERWATAVFGPGHGIQSLEGHLVVPANARRPSPDSQEMRPAAFALFSNDGGQSWQRGEVLDAPTNENQLVELDDGSLLVDARQAEGEHRWMAESRDGGQSWSEPRPGQTVTPVCCSILRYRPPGESEDAASLLLWTGPKGPGRKDLVLRISGDQGQSFPAERLIGPGRAAYSNMTLLDDDAVGVLWERGQAEGVPGGTVPETIRFTRIPREAIASLASDAAD